MGWLEGNTGLPRQTARENPAPPPEQEETLDMQAPQPTGGAALLTEREETPATEALAGDASPFAAPEHAPVMGAGEAAEDHTAEQALGAQLLRAVRERVGRAEKSVLRSMAEQRGVPEEHLADLLAKARAQETPAPTPQERQTDTAEERLRKRLLRNEVERMGAEMGLLDADMALHLLEEGFAKVEEDGEVTGVRESLESLRQRKGYLFAPPARAAWAQRVGTAAPALAGGVEEAFYRKNPALRK